MNRLTRKQVMFNGMLKRGKQHILEVGDKTYRISSVLEKKIRLKNVLLILQTVILTFIYRSSIEEYRDIPFQGMNEHLGEGLTKTFIFLFLITAGFIVTSILLIPKNVGEHVERIYE